MDTVSANQQFKKLYLQTFSKLIILYGFVIMCSLLIYQMSTVQYLKYFMVGTGKTITMFLAKCNQISCVPEQIIGEFTNTLLECKVLEK